MKFYHASTIRHRVGEVLVPKEHKYSGGMGIYLTTSPYPHETINAKDKKLFVYQVLPLNNKIKKGNWDDLVASYGIEIVKYVGEFRNQKYVSFVKNGKGIVAKRTVFKNPRFTIKINGYTFDSKIRQFEKIYKRGFNNLEKAKSYCDKVNKKLKLFLLQANNFYDRNLEFSIFDKTKNRID